MTSKQGIILFADRLPPLIGGMEMHAYNFIKHFINHDRLPLLQVITKDVSGKDCVLLGKRRSINISEVSKLYTPMFVFFNSGRWIEELEQIKAVFPTAKFLYRTGGNEVLKAPLIYRKITNHSLRQEFWVHNINKYIDVLITNSAYTESRLNKFGVSCSIFRCVGGVDALMLKPSGSLAFKQPTIFCAARFVPYKNHSLLISVIHKLVLRGNNFKVRLAGDGSLLLQIQKQVEENNLSSIVEFTGVLDNQQVCREISMANIYMQLSIDQVTKVPGGSYVHSEGMGRSILEAITAGTFVIAGRSGALPEIITKNRGILVDVNNLEQIVSIVEDVLKNPPPKAPFFDGYSWENFFRQYEDLLENIDEYIACYGKMRLQ